MPGSSLPGDGVTRPDAQLGGPACGNFEHGGNRFIGADRCQRIGYGIGSDRFDRSVPADEDDIERNHGILHPETRDAIFGERENHALVGRQLRPEHQTLGLLRAARRQFHDKSMGCFGCPNAERNLLEASFGLRQFAVQAGCCGFAGLGIASRQAGHAKQGQGKRDRF